MNERIVTRFAWGLLGVSCLVSGVVGSMFGLPSFLLTLAAGALSLVILLMWASLQQIDSEEAMGFEQALSYAAPSAEEEQKRALLRTLKDLEYELSVGKISRADYDQVSKEVRERAKKVIALSDESMKERILMAEARLAAYSKNKTLAAEKTSAKKDASEPKKNKKTKSEGAS